jgi:hypothetical protein
MQSFVKSFKLEVIGQFAFTLSKFCYVILWLVFCVFSKFFLRIKLMLFFCIWDVIKYFLFL